MLPLKWGALIAADNIASNVANYSQAINVDLWLLQIVGQGTETVASSGNVVS